MVKRGRPTLAFAFGLQTFESLLGLLRVAYVQRGELLLRHVFRCCELVVGAFDGDDQVGELDLQCQRVAVLAVLKQKHHQERDNRRAGVDDELPCVAETEDRTGGEPHNDNRQRRKKRRR